MKLPEELRRCVLVTTGLSRIQLCSLLSFFVVFLQSSSGSLSILRSMYVLLGVWCAIVLVGTAVINGWPQSASLKLRV